MNTSSRALVIGGGALIAMVLYISGLLVIFTPLPLFYVSVVKGRRDGLLAVALGVFAIATLYLFAFPAMGSRALAGDIYVPMPWLSFTGFFPLGFLKFAGIAYFFFFSAIAVVLGEGTRKKWPLPRWGGMAILAGLGVVVFVIIWSGFSGSLSVVDSARNYLQHMLAEVVKVNEAAQIEGSHIEFLKLHSKEVARFTFRIVPAIIFIYTLLSVVLNLVLGRRVIKGGQHAFAHIHNIARFRLHDGLIWLLIGAGVAFFLNHYILRANMLGALALNGLIILGALYFFQGLAVVVYFLQGIRFPLFRTLAYVAIIFFFQTVSLAIVLIGVADVWVDFRLRSWRARHHQSQ